jgi:ketosteroid isomerase-like protein
MTASIEDHLALQDLTARYAQHLSRGEFDEVVALFTPDGVYRAFGNDYPMPDFPALMEAAPRGQLIINPEVVDVDGDTATGSQHFTFIDQRTHEMRLAWYDDEFVPTADGWRIRFRGATFLRRHGGTDKGRASDPDRPEPGS